MAWDVDRLQLDPCRDLAEYLSIAAVGLAATRADTERWGQSGKNDPDIVSKLAHNVRHAKCLRRALEKERIFRYLEDGGQPLLAIRSSEPRQQASVCPSPATMCRRRA